MRKTITTPDGQSIVQMDLSDLGPITQHERDMIRNAGKLPVECDEDCPPLSQEMLEKARKIIAARPRIS